MLKTPLLTSLVFYRANCSRSEANAPKMAAEGGTTPGRNMAKIVQKPRRGPPRWVRDDEKVRMTTVESGTSQRQGDARIRPLKTDDKIL